MPLPDRPPVDDPIDVDTATTRYLSFGPSQASRGRFGSREPVPVGPGRTVPSPGVSHPLGAEVVREFPLQLSKVQRPPLRREILRRERLLDWLKVKIHNRIVLVTAEAGYGKTTLLADFARHHRRPAMWYRLDEDDRDWVSFVHYLVAAGRVVDPEFGSATKSLLAELGLGAGPSRDTIFATYLRDLQALGSGGAALVIDDYHLVDDIPDIRILMRELIAHGPERLTLVLASRQAPTLPLARLRTLGEVAELAAEDLRFDLAETERLFRDTYGRALEPDVLVDLADRTEGWAASLEMVNAAMRDRPPSEVRAFVRTLTGAHGDLYDYLAEEVVGDLGEELQRFLMVTSLLQVIDPVLTELVSDLSHARASELISDAERLGLLSRRGNGRRGERRFHPLVREFLESRLRKLFGDVLVRDLHRRVARHAQRLNWRLAAHHFEAAGDRDDLEAVIRSAVPSIMGGGEFALAESYFGQTAPPSNAAYELFASRMDLQRGRVESAVSHAESAVEMALHSNDRELSDYALANLVTPLFMSGQLERSLEVAQTLHQRTDSAVLGPISMAVLALVDGSSAGSLDAIRLMLSEMAAEQGRRGLLHYMGISLLNVAEADRFRGDVAGMLDAALRAIDALTATSAGLELESARSSLAWAHAFANRWDLAEEEMLRAQLTHFDVVRGEILVEHAQMQSMLGDREAAEGLLVRAFEEPLLPMALEDLARLTRAELALRRCDFEAAKAQLAEIDLTRPHPSLAFNARARFVMAWLSSANRSPSASRDAAAALHLAASQGARPYAAASRVLVDIADGAKEPDESLARGARDYPWVLSMLAEVITSRLGGLQLATFEAVAEEARRRPSRWREPLRLGIDTPEKETQYRSARLLDEIGEGSDVVLLRRVARSMRGRPGGSDLGRGLARRLARRVVVLDQGRVHVQIGDELVVGSDVRRKVLSLLCFLLTRPQLGATRDQVLDALWPDFDPDVAGNSLNQTVYFLRRVFEPAFEDETSPAYIHHDSDVLWLDPELVTSSSIAARAAIRAAETDPSPENVKAVSVAYLGPFALDFAYEDWASPYRDSLHAAYLEIIERAVGADTNAGAYDRAISLARRAVEVDPDAEHVELSLLKLYRRTGAHAAAAEQYAHYAAKLKDELGIDVPPLESL